MSICLTIDGMVIKEAICRSPIHPDKEVSVATGSISVIYHQSHLPGELGALEFAGSSFHME